MKVTGDLESRSTFDIRNGMHGYAEDPTTDIICFAIKAGEEDTKLWVAPPFRRLDKENFQSLFDEEFKEIVEKMDLWESHNCGFEYAMWQNIMVKRYGFPELPINKLRCSAAKAAVQALPRSLDGACKALKVDVQKDKIGKDLITKLCKPHKPKISQIKENPSLEGTLVWNEDPDKYDSFFRYCVTDVNAEHELSRVLPELSEIEQRIWDLDLKINNRGVCFDVVTANQILDVIKEQSDRLNEESLKISGGNARTSQRSAALKWLSSKKVSLYSYKKEDISAFLNSGKPIPEDVRRFLEIRQALGLTSAAKFKRGLASLSSGNRARGMFIYAGAKTLRWKSKGIQLHNMKKESFSSIEEVTDFLRTIDQSETVNLFKNITKCIRPMLKAREGSTFFCGDFSAIESRVLAWLVGDKTILNAYTAGKKIYKINAANIYKVKYEEVTEDQRVVGKVAELSLGYQGGVGAFMGMLEKQGVYDIDEDQVKNIVSSWRASRPLVTKFWYSLEGAAIKTIETGQPEICGRVKFWMQGSFLKCGLPDGTILSYAYAKVENIDKRYAIGKGITFWGVTSQSQKDNILAKREDNGKVYWGKPSSHHPPTGTPEWGKLSTYGGKLCENIVQSIARKLLAESMLRLETFGFKTVMHVHDEVVSEVPLKRPNYMTLDTFVEVMQVRPMWAKKLPLEVKAWEGERYRK